MAAGARLAAGLCAFALASCGNPPVQGDGDPSPRFQVGALELHATSGAAVKTAFGYGLYLTDQPDACAAITAVPQAIWTILSVWVAPQTGGAAQATVVAPVPTPAAGQAVVGLARMNRDTATTVYDGADGTIAWTAAADGTVTLTSIDVGFAGVSGRVTGQGMVLAPCSP